MGAGDVLGVTIRTVEDNVNDPYEETSRMSATGQSRMLVIMEMYGFRPARNAPSPTRDYTRSIERGRWARSPRWRSHARRVSVQDSIHTTRPACGPRSVWPQPHALGAFPRIPPFRRHARLRERRAPRDRTRDTSCRACRSPCSAPRSAARSTLRDSIWTRWRAPSRRVEQHLRLAQHDQLEDEHEPGASRRRRVEGEPENHASA